MRLRSGLILVALLFPATAEAAQIYGTLTEGRRPLSGADVRIECGSSSATARTDKFGAYRVFIGQTGKCSIEVRHGGATAQADVYSASKPARYNFELVKKGGAKLRRR